MNTAATSYAHEDVVERLFRLATGKETILPTPGPALSRLSEDLGRVVELAVMLRKYCDRFGAQAKPRAESTFRREGEFWTIAFDGRTIRLRDTAGLSYLATLLSSPGRDIPSTRLAGEAADRGDAGPVLDRRAEAQYRRRLEDLEDQLDEAEANRDVGRAGAAREEIRSLESELSRGFGLGGRGRRACSASERARQSVGIAVRRTISRITREHPSLAEHLRRSVRTGMFCTYDPDPRASVAWVL